MVRRTRISLAKLSFIAFRTSSPQLFQIVADGQRRGSYYRLTRSRAWQNLVKMCCTNPTHYYENSNYVASTSHFPPIAFLTVFHFDVCTSKYDCEISGGHRRTLNSSFCRANIGTKSHEKARSRSFSTASLWTKNRVWGKNFPGCADWRLT